MADTNDITVKGLMKLYEFNQHKESMELVSDLIPAREIAVGFDKEREVFKLKLDGEESEYDNVIDMLEKMRAMIPRR